MPTSEKPGISVKSEKDWIESRVKELASTVSKHANRGHYPKSMKRLAEELLRRVCERVNMED